MFPNCFARRRRIFICHHLLKRRYFWWLFFMPKFFHLFSTNDVTKKGGEKILKNSWSVDWSLAASHCRIGCAGHSILNIPQPLLSRAVQSNCLGLSGPDPSCGRSGWCSELPNKRGFHLYNFRLLHSAPWPYNSIWNSELPLPALSAISTKTIPDFLAKNSVNHWKVLISLTIVKKIVNSMQKLGGIKTLAIFLGLDAQFLCFCWVFFIPLCGIGQCGPFIKKI